MVEDETIPHIVTRDMLKVQGYRLFGDKTEIKSLRSIQRGSFKMGGGLRELVNVSRDVLLQSIP